MTIDKKIPLSQSMVSLFNAMLIHGRMGRLHEMVNYYEQKNYDVTEFVEELKKYESSNIRKS